MANLQRNSAASLVACAFMCTSPFAGAQVAGRLADIAIDADDIAGVVAGDHGPEAGVWVIAETTDLPTKFRKIVVTDDAGPLLAARPAARQLRNLGAWLRARGFAEHSCDTGQSRAAAGRDRA